MDLEAASHDLLNDTFTGASPSLAATVNIALTTVRWLPDAVRPHAPSSALLMVGGEDIALTADEAQRLGDVLHRAAAILRR